MSLRSLNEGFEVSYFNLLRESTLREIDFLLSSLNEAGMSDEDRRDSQILRQIRSKANSVEYDKRRALNWTPAELAVADKYNLTLPQKKRTYNGVVVTPMKDNDVDYERGHGRNIETRNLDRDIQQARGVGFRRDANLADFIRKRKTKGPRQDRPYREADKYARVDDVDTFGDTTFTHDTSGRFGQDSWDKEHGRAPSLAGSRKRNADLTDVEKDRVRVNKQMSQPVRDMKAALADRKSNQQDLDNVNLNYARNVADARRRFDDAMAYADEQRQKESERGRRGVDTANSTINKLLKRESLRRAIEEKLASLNEAEMSDEDKRDTEILKNIYKKTQLRSNAALTPEEKEVLKKYDLERVPYLKNIRRTTSSPEAQYSDNLFGRDDFKADYDYLRMQRTPAKADKINYADRARKRPERDVQKFDMRDRDSWGTSTPDYERMHEIDGDDYRPATYQQRQRQSDNQKMTQDVRDMKRALRTRKDSQAKLDSAEYVHQAEMDKLRKEYEDKLARAQRSQQYRTDSHRRDLEGANKRINSLLGKEN